MKTLWIVGGGIEAVPGIKRAKEMGLHVVVSDGDENAPGFDISDEFFVVSTYDIEQTVATASRYHSEVNPVAGVICIAADVPLTVAAVSEKLGLPGLPVEAAHLSMNKLEMKHRFKETNIPIPWYSEVSSLAQLKEALQANGFPLVLKPVDSRGARGVLRLTEDVDLDWAINHSMRFSPSKKLMVEEFLEGPQISTEAIVNDGIGYPVGFTDRNYELMEQFSPFIIENGGEFPSIINSDDQELISSTAINAGLALGVRTGVIKGDMVLTEDGPKVIEIATRLSGGWFSTDQIPIGLGVDLVGAAINLSLGEDVIEEDLSPKFKRGVAVRYFFPTPGIVTDISHMGLNESKSWIHRLHFFIKPGEVVHTPSDHTKRAGFVITTGKDRKQAVERAQFVCSQVKIHTRPL